MSQRLSLLVANTSEKADIDELLDKPFDELTPYEGEYLKQHPQAEELSAA
ncbi:MAG: hypothetical protein DSM106950_39800 [Stigonema ocellatum SAG 48.90 = DSM 106950]|nr:hypothetical protein [Stigonema ocellatum SAG 48.90 = DSM 106950]